MVIAETCSPEQAAREAAREILVYQSAFRKRRLAMFLSVVDEIVEKTGRCRVLDLGGVASYWLGLEDLWRDRPMHMTLVNLATVDAPDARFVSLAGDARSLPQFADRAFDVVHSNSVIEHVGSMADKRRMATEVRRLAPRYFVQTPNYWFPVEPHFRMAAFHWLPRRLQRALVMSGARGFYPQASSLEQADAILADAALLDAGEMRDLFPDATVHRERAFGLTKSLIAIR